MRRFDQCTTTCTTDCGHCKGRPIEEMRAALERYRVEVERLRQDHYLDEKFRRHADCGRRCGADCVVEPDIEETTT